MTNKIDNITSIKNQLRPYLKAFLQDNGIDIQNNMLRCLSPNHEDKNASMKILADLNNEKLYCYGCHVSADIFTVNNWLNKAPLYGSGFITDNIYPLANKYKVAYEPIQYTKEQLESLLQYRFIKIVADLLVPDNGYNISYKHTDKRKWSQETCKKLYIASIEDYDVFLKQIQDATGYSLEDIKHRGIKPELFGPDRITVTIFNETGAPVGFTTRDVNWKEGSEGSKYVNSATSSIFKKSTILYGINFASRKTNKRLDIFEGCGSFIKAHQEGHACCAAILGSALTTDQVQLLIQLGFTNINLVLDNDKTGLDKMNKYIESLSDREGLKASIMILNFKEKDIADKKKDVEDFIDLYGINNFFKQKPISAYQYLLDKNFKDKTTLTDAQISTNVTKIIHLILNTENRIERGLQIKELAQKAEVLEEDIRDEINRIQSKSVDIAKRNLEKSIRLASDSDELLTSIELVKSSLEDSIESKANKTRLSVGESLTNLTDFKNLINNKKIGIQGWKTGFNLLDQRLSGIPKPVGFDDDGNQIMIPGSIFGIAGTPQAGKSTIIQNIAYNIAKLNTDVSVLFWALDDSRERIYERLLAVNSGVPWLAVTRRTSITEEQKKLVNNSFDELHELVSSGRLVLKDHSVGSTLPLLRKWIEVNQSKSNRPILLIIDSFHKINASGSEAGISDNSQIRRFCQYIKSLVQTHNITAVASLEMNKGATRGIEPDTLNISESRKIEYDFDILAIAYNHYYDMDGESDQVIKKDNKIFPLIKFNIRKSKDGGSGPIYFALDTDNFKLKDYSLSEIKTLLDLEEVKSTTINDIKINTPIEGNLIKKKPGRARTSSVPWE